jgi:hypothetical protein
MSRSAELLKAAADALEDGRDPLELSFLTEHSVSLDECCNLAESLALGARLYAWAMENPKMARAAAQGANIGMRLDFITRMLREMNGED